MTELRQDRRQDGRQGRQDGLAQRIMVALKKGADQVMLCDECVTWTGQEISVRMKQLQEMIETLTPPGARVAVAFPTFAVQALAIFSVIACSRVPVILSDNDFSPGSSSNQRLKMENVKLLISLAAESNGQNNEDLLSRVVPYLLLNRLGEIQATCTKVPSPSPSPSPSPLSAPAVENQCIENSGRTALVLFTSGSTGEPKGVHVPEQGLIDTIDYLTKYFGIDHTTVAPIALPISHSMALNTQLFPTFLAGGKSLMMNSWASVGHVYRTILDQKGTFVALIGEMLRVCWEEKNRRGLPSADHVKHVQLAGGMITERHIQLARDLFPNATLHKGYGLTEAIRVSMIDSNDPEFGSAAVGKPLPFLDIEIRDQVGQLVGPLTIGEIFIKGSSVLLGWSGSSKVRIGEDQFLASGDLGYWNRAGQLCISGRADGVFKINGHRVSCTEIEKLALETSDLIRDAKCIAVEDHEKAANKVVLLLEVPRDSQDDFLYADTYGDTTKIWKKMQKLQHFPKEVVIMARFPRRVNGKLAISQLKSLYDIHLQRQRMTALKIPNSRLQFFKLPNIEIDDQALSLG